MQPTPIAVILSAIWLSPCIQAQQPNGQGPAGSVKLTGGPTAKPIVLRVVDPPASGDSITVTTSTTHIQTALVTPRGERITKENSAAAGLKWIQGLNLSPPLGSAADPGYYTTITFLKAGAAGAYTLQFSIPAGKTTATAKAWFTSRMQDYRRLIQAIPGARMPDPVASTAASKVIIDVDRDTDKAVFNVVVPNAAARVELALPDGRVLRHGDGSKDVDWSISIKDTDQSFEAGMLDFMGLLLPIPGVQHVIAMQAAKGRYEIRAAANGSPAGGFVRAAFFSLSDFEQSDAAKLIRRKFNPNEPVPGQVRIHLRPMPGPFFAGGQLELAVGLAGPVGAEPPAFEVRIENVSSGNRTNEIPFGRSDPVVMVPVQFTRGGDGSYHGTVPLARAGRARIEVRARGKTASGQPFTDQALVEANVFPVLARVISMDAKAVDADGDGKFDRLEVTVNLDVIEPGEYMMSAYASGPAEREARSPTSSRALAAGRQQLTTSIPASQIWSQLREGPYEIHVSQIFRVSSEAPVPDSQRVFQSPAYRRDQWDRGPLFGADQVSVHGIRPAASGRFRLAEVDWDVTTPGGQCQWNGTLHANRGTLSVGARQAAVLPAGPRTLRLFFDGAALAASGQREFRFSETVWCPGAPGNTALPERTLTFDPGAYEPAPHGLRVEVDGPLWMASPGLWITKLWVPGKAKATTQFRVAEVSNGVEAKLLDDPLSLPAGVAVTVQLAADAPSGPHFIRIATTSGGETAETELVLDDGSPAP